MVNILERTQFVVNSKGQKTAVVLDYTLWEELMTILEDVEDAEELRQLQAADIETVSWEQAKRELLAFLDYLRSNENASFIAYVNERTQQASSARERGEHFYSLAELQAEYECPVSS